MHVKASHQQKTNECPETESRATVKKPKEKLDLQNKNSNEGQIPTGKFLSIDMESF